MPGKIASSRDVFRNALPSAPAARVGCAVGDVRCPACQSLLPEGTETCPHDGTRLSVSDGPDPLIGQTIDNRYEILEVVGTGGMGTVYRAMQVNVGRDVAVKVVNALALQQPETVRRFETEARIISQLKHPNTLKLIDFGKLPDARPYLVTEFLSGVSLESLLRQGPMQVDWTIRVLRQICDALIEAHAKGIVHRDLKPENLFIEDIGNDALVRVLDFGIAKLGQTSHTATGTVFGTPAYMSPEQAHGKTALPQSDLYALGIIAYRCLAGHLPFEADQPLALLLKQVHEAPVPLSQAMAPRPCAPQLEALVMGMLAKDPEARPRSAAEVRAHLDHLLGRTPAHTPAPHLARTPPPQLAPAAPTISHAPVSPFAPQVSVDLPTRRPWVLWASGIGLLMAAIAIVAVMAWQQNPEPEVNVVTKPAPLVEPTPPPEVRTIPREDPPAPALVEAPPAEEPKKKKKKKKTAEDPQTPDAPPGFVDFDVE